MRVIGQWLDRVDTHEGYKEFENSYDMSYFEAIVQHELFNITRMQAKDKRHIVFLEHDGDFNQILTLDDGDLVYVYNDIEDTVFNSDGFAFIRVFNDSNDIGAFSVENSPYDMTPEEIQKDMDVDPEEILVNLNKKLKENSVEHIATFENTLFVCQL